MNWRCRWFGHKRRSLDGNSATVSIYNVDACDRCGVLLRATGARGFGYVDTSRAPEHKPPGRVNLGDDRRDAIRDAQRDIGRRLFGL